MSLVKEITKGLLPEEEQKTVGIYAGGFKPPTKGHFEVLKLALEQNPEIDEMLVLIGKKERDGVTQEDSLKIWNIYSKYLPFKVKYIKSTVAPIREVYDYAKENPNTEVLWVIGAREESEEDFTDIASRTKGINKYPNLELRTIITKGGVSGTAARNAANTSKEKLDQFLPDVLSDEEKQDIYTILTSEISEADPKTGTGKKPKGSSRRLYTDEDPTDTVGVKFSSKQDIIDTFNKASFKAKSHARQSQIINLVHQRVRAAYNRAKDPEVKKRLKTALDYAEQRKEASKAKTQRLKDQKENIDPKSQSQHKGKAAPYGSGYKKLNEFVKSDFNRILYYQNYFTNVSPSTFNIEIVEEDIVISGINKPYPSNFDDTTNTRQVSVNQELEEQASYSNHIDYKQKIKELTKYMVDKGMNIIPLPKVRLIHKDSSNAKDFFGKTAYYDPNNKEIVLYTEGRHPKDIVRSFSHEMVHHEQNLENRLGNIQTTNTQEDDHLDKIEQEANLKGTMSFRNWTDSLQEKKTKDPFGLNAYAAELARLREDKDQYKVYLDMDGVLADFDQRFRSLSGMEPQEFEDKYGTNEFWDFIDEKNKVKFWVGIPVMQGAKQLVDAVKDYNYEILTAPSAKKQSRLGKILWIKNHQDIFGGQPKINFKKAKEKHLVKPELSQYDILVDDRKDTINRWNEAGGTGIFYQNVNQVLSDLKKLGL